MKKFKVELIGPVEGFPKEILTYYVDADAWTIDSQYHSFYYNNSLKKTVVFQVKSSLISVISDLDKVMPQ